MRASELFGDGYTVLPDHIEAENIVQGNLGDCYFLSALSALAAHPDRIKRLFKTTVPTGAGCYVVQMCVGGVWQDIAVDDYIPTSGGYPVFGHSNDNSIWVALLEKAWAKLCGSYANIIMGAVDLAFIHLCGMPSVAHPHGKYRANKDPFWRALVQAQA